VRPILVAEVIASRIAQSNEHLARAERELAVLDPADQRRGASFVRDLFLAALIGRRGAALDPGQDCIGRERGEREQQIGQVALSPRSICYQPSRRVLRRLLPISSGASGAPNSGRWSTSLASGNLATTSSTHPTFRAPPANLLACQTRMSLPFVLIAIAPLGPRCTA
jgi:hypothetical protein